MAASDLTAANLTADLTAAHPPTDHAEPGRTEPGRTEPGRTEPGRTEPGRTEPGRTEPGRTEPGRTEPDRGETTSSLASGLDALETITEFGPPLRLRLRRKTVPPLVAVALVITVWQLVYLAGIKPDYALPGPLQTWDTFVEQWKTGRVVEVIANSLHRGGLGFLFSVAIGTPLGLLVARVRPVRTAIGPVLSGLQSLPSVAWVPASVILFGLTDATIYAVVLLGAVPSIANGLVAGIDHVPPLYLRVGRVLGARGLDSVRYVLLPAALPGYLAGLKQGWAFSWRSLMAAELITLSPDIGMGLGQFLNEGRDFNDMSLVLVGIFLILTVGMVIELLFFGPLERRMLRSRGLTGAVR